MDKAPVLEFENNEEHGRGAWWQGRFLYWQKTLSRSAIALNKLQRRVDHVLDILVFIGALVGVLSLLTWLLLSQEILLANPLKILFFWENKHPLVLVFLLSTWLDLFLLYRRSEASVASRKINHRHFRGGAKGKPIHYNVAGACNQEMNDVLSSAFLIAAKLKQPEVSVMHFFRALLTSPQIQNVFVRLGVNATALLKKLERHLSGPQAQNRRPEFSEALREILLAAGADAIARRQDSLEPLNALSFCYHQDTVLAEILYDLEVDADKLDNVCEWFHINRQLASRYRAYRQSAGLKPGGGMDRAYTAIATPTLDHFSHDLTAAAKYGRLELCVGRSAEINSIFEIMESGQAGVLLVGASGTGKNVVINGIAQLMVEERVPKFLQDKRLVEIDVSRLVSGGAASEAEARLLACINEASRAGNIILHIANIENLVGISAGGEGLDLSEVLAESLSRRIIFCLSTIGTDNYSRVLEKTALGEVMTTVGIKEPGTNQAIQMLESKVAGLENKYRIFITYSAIEEAVLMSSRYLHDKFLPEKAVSLLQAAVIIAAKANRRNPQNRTCTKEHVAAAISEMTGIPAQKITEDESHKLLSLENDIHQRMVGQEEAVNAVAASLRRARAEMKDAKRPIASFLFLGPTGVGKTELAKTVSQVYFGDENYMVRLDMSEYQSVDSIRKMIGDIDGSLGYLTEAVRKKPFSLILLDEIEKAHPDILNLFLQLLDDGRLTDGQGRTISFTESIIIATSNIGALYIQEQIKAGTDTALIRQELIDNQLNKVMRPELINRFDGIIVFKPLSTDNIFQIATLMLKGIKKRLAEKGLDLKADREGVKLLAKAGYDPKFGARPLRRLLQDRVEDKIANKILAGELKRRDTVVIDAKANISVLKGREL